MLLKHCPSRGKKREIFNNNKKIQRHQVDTVARDCSKKLDSNKKLYYSRAGRSFLCDCLTSFSIL